MRCQNSVNSFSQHTNTYARKQDGFALVTVLILVIIVGIISTSMLDTSDQSQQVSSALIQRNRAFQAIDTALGIAEIELLGDRDVRRFANPTASDGVYSHEAREDQWWRHSTYGGESTIDAGRVLGVVEQPRYTLEELGNYISDGGTGIVSLNTGSGAYGRQGNGVREVVLYSLEAYGKGSYDVVQAAAESIVILNQ